MATLIYAPQIKVHIETAEGTRIDVSEDLVQWQLILRENAPHTFSCVLQNAQRKYDGTFIPMDKIRVMLKRISWLQCFTGYINTSPIFQAWPSTLNLSATCTLKIPMYHYWDPNSWESFALVQDALGNLEATNDKTKQGDNKGGTEVQNGESALTNLIIEAMTKVLNWDKSKIHLGKIPDGWAKWANKVYGQMAKDIEIYKTLGHGAIINGAATGPGVNLPVGGKYGGWTLSAAQSRNASAIYNALVGPLGMANRQDVKIMTFMCAFVESGLKMYANANNPDSLKLPHDAVGSDHGSVGLFQQQVGGATNSTANWGTTAELMDPEISTKKFVNRLLTFISASREPGASEKNESQYGAWVQDVQGSAKPDAYQQQLGAAKALVTDLDKVAGTTSSSTSPSSSSNDSSSSTPTGDISYSTGNMIARQAANLIHVHKSGNDGGSNIAYHEGGDNPDSRDVAKVDTLDCSSLVDWCYYHSTSSKHLAGAPFPTRSTVATIRPKVKKIPTALAYQIRGAVLIEDDGHVGVSLGNGNHVAAHGDVQGSGIHLPHQTDISPAASGGNWTQGGLLPGIDYSGSANTQAAADQLAATGIYKKTTVAPPDPILTKDAPADPSLGAGTGVGDTTGTGSTADPIAQLVDGLYFSPERWDTLANSLGGAVMLANDVPFLPWLQNVVKSSMRSFCSAPNGDFIAWFPDYFGIWGTAGIMDIETVELQDFAVYWDDQAIVTHQFVVGNPDGAAFDFTSGTVGYLSPELGGLAGLLQGYFGVASMDYPEIFEAIYGDGSMDSGTISAFLERFGARPNIFSEPRLNTGGNQEFFYALYTFMLRWAGMFTAQVPVTFMPELFPGMLIRIKDYHFQAYVQGVTHSGSFGQGGGFTTSISIAAAATTGPDKSRTTRLALLPVGSAHSTKDKKPDTRRNGTDTSPKVTKK